MKVGTMQVLGPYKTERETVAESIMLDANEHYRQWVNVPPSMLSGLNRYPDRSARVLRQKLAEEYCGGIVQADNILMTSGSIEAIDILIAAYKPSRLIINTPSYDIYKLRADAHGYPSEFIPLDSFSQPQTDKIIERATKDSITVFISPNNPTGKLPDRARVRKVIQQSRGIVVIDEAYIEFAGLQHSMLTLTKEYPNVIILRTFSKAWGLAGIRLGYVIGHESNIEHLSAYQNTYSVNAMALNIGLYALDQQDELIRQVEQVRHARHHLVGQFKRLGIDTYETDANFLVIDVPDVQAIHQTLREKSILVRPRPLIGNQRNGLRITVGSPEENETMFNVVARSLF